MTQQVVFPSNKAPEDKIYVSNLHQLKTRLTHTWNSFSLPSLICISVGKLSQDTKGTKWLTGMQIITTKLFHSFYLDAKMKTFIRIHLDI